MALKPRGGGGVGGRVWGEGGNGVGIRLTQQNTFPEADTIRGWGGKRSKSIKAKVASEVS